MRDGKTISDVADGMRANGWDHSKPPPEMVAYPDGRVVTLDHRRLVAADKAGIEEVPARVHAADESMPPSEARRFALKTEFADPETGQTYFKGDLPTNWGEAAKFRSANQRAMGFPDFPIEGRPGLPPIRAPK